jgi:pimeloyl-ACP methyl ester carboxylesterase
VSEIFGRDVWFESTDGVKLYARDWGPVESSLMPLLCLPGLTRNHLDFEPVAGVFGKDRRVIGLDFRGRHCAGGAVGVFARRLGGIADGHQLSRPDRRIDAE